MMVQWCTMHYLIPPFGYTTTMLEEPRQYLDSWPKMAYFPHLACSTRCDPNVQTHV